MKIKVTTGSVLGVIILAILILIGFGYLFNAFIKMLNTTGLILFFLTMMVAAFVYEVIKRKRKSRKSTELLTLGAKVFPDFEDEFTNFYSLYLKDTKKFVAQNLERLTDFKSPKPIEVAYVFATSKNLVQLIDWKGEENEGEIEAFIDGLLKEKLSWEESLQLRKSIDPDEQRDGQFIVDLFRSIDKDLRKIKQRLLFFDLGSDSYAYTVVSLKNFGQIKKDQSTVFFYGVDKLNTQG